MTGVVLHLLEIGYSAATTSMAIALTAIPNVFFGQLLGRWVDRSSKKKLFVGLSLYLATIELFLLGASGWWSGSHSAAAVITLMVAFSFGYSPLMTLIYTYLVPSLDNDESRIFVLWEKANAVAMILGGLIGFILLHYVSAGWLILLHVFTLIIAAALIPKLWRPLLAVSTGAVKDELKSPKTSGLALIKSLIADRTLVVTAFTMWVLAMSVVSVENNNLAIGWLELKLGTSFSALSVCLYATINLFGSQWLSSQSNWLKANLIKTQRRTLIASACILSVMCLGSVLQVPELGFVSLLLISFLEPTTSVTSNLLIRSRVDMQKIGEVYGLIRMPRALFTILGTTIIGWSQDAQLFPIVIFSSVLLLVLAVIANQRIMRLASNVASLQKVA